jgi:iron complex transport system ATP-binding protein
VAVLDDVSLTVDEGEFVGLVGPNGAGKTTLLQTLNGVLDPDAGTVTVDGHAVHESSARTVGRLVATVPQHGSVGFDFAVEDIVAMGRTPYHSRFGGADYAADRRHVERALEKTDVAAFAERSIDAVSGGERQRVLLARALAQDTPVLLLDEPTASLDINHQVETLSLVADLAAEGKTAVAAIHDLDLAARFCDRLVLVADGGVLADGTPEAVLRGDLLGDAFDADAAVATDAVTGTPTVTAFRESPDRDLRAHVVGSGALAARTVARLVDGGVTVTLGPVPDGDVAAETARARDVDAVTAPPFAPPGEPARGRAADLAAAADVVVRADPPVGSDRPRAIGDAGPTVRVSDDPATGAAPVTVETVLAAVVSAAPGREVSADD